MSKPLILITNDDGYQSKGIKSLLNSVKDLGRIILVAPDRPQSGMGHAISVNKPIRCFKIDVSSSLDAYSCTGTPVDCVKMGLFLLKGEKPDLILSGINHGSNSSINVIYSGTMSAAIEATLEGIPSIGFSLLDYSQNADFSASKRIVRVIVEKSLQEGIPKGRCLNVNIPKLIYSDIKGYKICRQSDANWVENFDQRKDPTGRNYYWLTGVFQNLDKGKDTDEWALDNGYVSIVPVQYDITAYDYIKDLKSWNL